MRVIKSKNDCKKETAIHILEFLFVSFVIPLFCISLFRIIKNPMINFILYGIEGASPALAVIFVVLAHDKVTGLRKYLHDKYFSNFNLKICFFGFLVPFLILTCAKITAIFFGDVHSFLSPLTVRKILIISWALIAEELGWRGYLQDKLDSILPSKYIPLITGMIWALWHYHFMLSGSMEVPIIAFALGCIFESYGYYTLTKYAKNNIVPASIWHFTGNLMFNLYRFDPQWHNGNIRFYWITTIFYAATILLFIFYERKWS